MKILAVMGSPKGKGSGYRAVQMIERRMKELGDVEFESPFLKDMNLGSCMRCYTCMLWGEDRCPLKDDQAAIEKKALEADGLIFSSPVYVQNVSWLMKNFIDRFAYTNHRPRFHGQKALLVANSGGSGQKPALAAMRYALGGMQVVHRLALSTPPWPETEAAVAKKEKLIDAAALKFYRACRNTTLPSPGITDYMIFLITKKVMIGTRDIMLVDYQFYSGKEYYYDTKVNPLTKLLSEALLRLVFFMMRDRMPGNVK